MAAITTQQPAPVPAPAPADDAVAYEGDRCFIPDPTCPACGSRHIIRNGPYERNPQGRRPPQLPAGGPLGIQQYECRSCDHSFSPSLPFIEDGFCYTDDLRRDVQAADLIYLATTNHHETFATVRHGVTPSRTALYDWAHSTAAEDRTTPTEQVVVNDLPTYSGVYLLDEDWITIDGKRWYRVTVFDALMKAPVLEGLTEAKDNEAIKRVVEPGLWDKPMRAIVTDGRSGSASLVADELGALHYRCGAHKVGNVQKAVGASLAEAGEDEEDPSDMEQIAVRRIGAEVCDLLTTHSRPDGLAHCAGVRDRFEDVLDEVERAPTPLQKQLRSIETNYDKFMAHHRVGWLPGTNNELENYYRHTQPDRVEHRFRSPERLLSFLDQQMTLWTVKRGLVSQETSRTRAHELFPYLDSDSVEALFSAQKQHFLWSCDVWAG